MFFILLWLLHCVTGDTFNWQTSYEYTYLKMQSITNVNNRNAVNSQLVWVEFLQFLMYLSSYDSWWISFIRERTTLLSIPRCYSSRGLTKQVAPTFWCFFILDFKFGKKFLYRCRDPWWSMYPWWYMYTLFNIPG